MLVNGELGYELDSASLRMLEIPPPSLPGSDCLILLYGDSSELALKVLGDSGLDASQKPFCSRT